MLLKEPGLYCFLLKCKRIEAEPFMEWVVETVLPHEVRRLSNQLSNQQKEIEEKDAAIVLLNDDLQNREYENVALQAQKDVYEAELQKYLGTRYVPHMKNPGKDNIVIIVQKHTTSANDKFHDLPYYFARIQRRKRDAKLRWFDQHYPDHEIIVEIDNPNSIHAFNRFEEEGHAEQRYNHFKLTDLTREDLYTLGVPAILDDEE